LEATKTGLASVSDNTCAGRPSTVECVEDEVLIGRCKQDNGKINIDETASVIRISIGKKRRKNCVYIYLRNVSSITHILTV
jgi:hypothetical protein